MKKFLPVLFPVIFFSSCTQNSKTPADVIPFAVSQKFEDTTVWDPSWSKENTLVYHTTTEPENLHPTNGSSNVRTEINGYTQMGLLVTDIRELAIVPALVKSLPEADSSGLEFTYELSPLPKWDDGTPVTVNDVIFFFKAIKCPLTNNPQLKVYFSNVKELRTHPDQPSRFTLVMNEPYIQNVAFLLDIPLVQQTFFDPENILSRYSISDFNNPDFKPEQHPDLVEWANEYNHEKYGRDPAFINGLGMYKVEKWDAGQSVTLIKKKNHWAENSSNPMFNCYPEKIIFRVNRDDNSTMLEFKSQTLDASTLISARNLMALKSNPEFNKNYHSAFTPTYSFTYIALNQKPVSTGRKKIFDDILVRKAMAYLTPVDQLIKLVYSDYSNSCRRMTTNVSPLKKDHNSSLPAIALDIEKGKRLLTEAGWTDSDGDGVLDKIIDGQKTDLKVDLNYIASVGDWKDMAALVSEQMSKAGVKVTPIPLDVKLFIEKGRTHNFDMMLGSFSGVFLPEDFTQLWHTSSWTSNGSNFSGFGNANSDALIDSIKVTLDDTKRNPMTLRLQEMIYEDQPMVFLYTNMRRVILHKRFGNCEFYAERPGILLNQSKILDAGGKPVESK